MKLPSGAVGGGAHDSPTGSSTPTGSSISPDSGQPGQLERAARQPGHAPLLDPRVLRRRHHRQRQVLADDARRAAPLPLPLRQRQNARFYHHADLQPAGCRHAPERRRRARRSGRSDPTAASSTRPSSWTIRPTVRTPAPVRRSATTASARGRQVSVPRAGRAGRRHRRLHRSGRQDVHACKNCAVIPFPSGGPVGFGAPDATSDGQVMKFKVDMPLQGTDRTFNPGRQSPRALRAAPIVNIKNTAPNKKRAADPGRGGERHGQPGRAGSPVDEATPVESLLNNSKWNGNREGTTTPSFRARSRTATAWRRPRIPRSARPRSGRWRT